MSHISHTQITMLLRCARQYEFRYVHGLKEPPDAARLLGISYHRALETNHRQKIETRADLPVEAVVDAFADAWQRELDKAGEVQWNDDDPGQVKDDGVQMTAAYVERLAPTIQPAAVEKRFEVQVDGVDVPLVGYIDLVEESGFVVDDKTAAKAWSQADADRSLQPSAYLLARRRQGHTVAGFRFDVAVNKLHLKRNPRIEFVRLVTDRSAWELEWYEDLVRRVYAQITTGLFPPNPTGWWCNPKWCGYWGRCRGATARSFPAGAIIAA